MTAHKIQQAVDIRTGLEVSEDCLAKLVLNGCALRTCVLLESAVLAHGLSKDWRGAEWARSLKSISTTCA